MSKRPRGWVARWGRFAAAWGVLGVCSIADSRGGDWSRCCVMLAAFDSPEFLKASAVEIPASLVSSTVQIATKAAAGGSLHTTSPFHLFLSFFISSFSFSLSNLISIFFFLLLFFHFFLLSYSFLFLFSFLPFSYYLILNTYPLTFEIQISISSYIDK